MYYIFKLISSGWKYVGARPNNKHGRADAHRDAANVRNNGWQCEVVFAETAKKAKILINEQFPIK